MGPVQLANCVHVSWVEIQLDDRAPDVLEHVDVEPEVGDLGYEGAEWEMSGVSFTFLNCSCLAEGAVAAVTFLGTAETQANQQSTPSTLLTPR